MDREFRNEVQAQILTLPEFLSDRFKLLNRMLINLKMWSDNLKPIRLLR